MIISCPSCGASFNIKPEVLGPNGRSVKCSKCANRWHATVDGAAQQESEPAPAPAAPVAAEDAAAAAFPFDEAPQAEAADAPSESPAAAPATPDENAAAPAADDTPAESPPPPGLQEALGLAASAGADDSAPEPARPARRKAAAPARKPRKSKAKILSLFVLLLLVCGAAGVAVFMKREIMMWLPATQRLYAMVGMAPEALGHGLQIVEPKPKKEIDGNDEILVVEGEIRNVAQTPVEVPLMRGALLDKNGKELHIWTFTAAKSRIGPGELAQYRTEFRNPPADAQSLDITFTRAGAAPVVAKHEAKAEPKKQDGAKTNGGGAQQH